MWFIEVHRRARLQQFLESLALEGAVGVREAEFWARVRSLEALPPDLAGAYVLGFAYSRITSIETRWGTEVLYAMTLDACPYWNTDLVVFFIAKPIRAGVAADASPHYGVVHVVGYSLSTEREAEIGDVQQVLA